MVTLSFVLLFGSVLHKLSHGKTCLRGFLTGSTQSQFQKMARGLKTRIKEVHGVYCLCYEIKGTDMHLCFRIWKNRVYSDGAAHTF